MAACPFLNIPAYNLLFGLEIFRNMATLWKVLLLRRIEKCQRLELSVPVFGEQD